MTSNDARISFLVDNVKDGIGNLRMRVRWSGNTVAVNLGYKIYASKWDAEEQRCKPNTSHLDGRMAVLATDVNRCIRKYRECAERIFDTHPAGELTKDNYRRFLRESLGKSSGTSSESVFPKLRQYVLRQHRMGAISDGTAQSYMLPINRLESFRKDLRISDINDTLLEEYTEYLLCEGLSNRYIKHHTSVLKSLLLKCGYKLEYSPRLRVVPHTIVWLTWDELLSLYNADLSAMRKWEATDLEAVRDMFCFSCFTGFRYSDIQGLRASDIVDGKISRKIQKTSASVQVELNKYSREIISKYTPLPDGHIFPRLRNTDANHFIRRITKHVGLDEQVTLVDYRGGRRIEKVKPKWSALSMHCGRRTFICNALSKGISPNIIMKWTGHSDYDAMRPYIDIADRAKEDAMLVFER